VPYIASASTYSNAANPTGSPISDQFISYRTMNRTTRCASDDLKLAVLRIARVNTKRTRWAPWRCCLAYCSPTSSLDVLAR
jgi:hypothetical protein